MRLLRHFVPRNDTNLFVIASEAKQSHRDDVSTPNPEEPIKFALGMMDEIEKLKKIVMGERNAECGIRYSSLEEKIAIPYETLCYYTVGILH